MKKIISALMLLFILASCAGTKQAPIVKKEKINIYEVVDNLGELKEKETPLMIVIRECNQDGNIEKMCYYDGEKGGVLFSQVFSYDGNGKATKYVQQAINGFFSMTESVYNEGGRWFKNEDGDITLLGEDYEITNCVYTDFVKYKEDGSCVFALPILEAECEGEILEKDKYDRWIKFSAKTQLASTPRLIFIREFVEVW